MSTISEVKERTDIVALVSEHVQLAKAGKNYKGLCPFHGEKHGSFFVFPDRQTWHCFGACGAGGDAFSFVMKRENVDFGGALQILADRAGIALKRYSQSSSQEDDEKDRLLAALETAAEYYRSLLLTSDSAHKAREYVALRSIHLDSSAAEEFRIGYSPSGWTSLKGMLLSRGYAEQELLDAGLLTQREDGRTYDRFRDRLMFPIFESSGKVIGFGARALGDLQPKYLNSPQSRVFDKSQVLYGIHRAKAAARRADRIILVEGYTDVIQAHQNGWENVVAPMGTSLTEHHAGMISRITRNIYLALDADEAGVAAAMKTIRETAGRLSTALGQRTVMEFGPKGRQDVRSVLDADIRIIVLPQGQDPDEILSKAPEAWSQLVSNAVPYVDFYVDTLVRSTDTSSARGKRDLLAACEPIIGEIEDPMERSRFYARLSRALEISERDLSVELLSMEKQRTRNGGTRTAVRTGAGIRRSSSATEEYCLWLLLNNPDWKEHVDGLEADLFETTENRRIYEAWCSSADREEVRASLDAPLVEHLDFLLSKSFPPGVPSDHETQQRALNECILRLQERHTRRQQFLIETTLQRERQELGIDAELAILERTGIASNARLHEIFLLKNRRRREKRG